MRLSVILPETGRIDQIVDVARRAEAAGLDGAYCVEGPRGGVAPIAAAAVATRRIRLGTYILNAYGRSAFLTGIAAVDLDELSGGRLVLGVGAGNRHVNERYQGLEMDRAARKMREYVDLLRRIVSARPGERVSYEGELHRMTGWTPRVAPVRETIPIVLAASYPAMRRCAGRVADGVALGTLYSPAYVRDVIAPEVRAAAEGAGRDPDAVAIMCAVWLAVDPDREVARDAIRRTIVDLFAPTPHPYCLFLMAEQGFASAAEAIERLVADERHEAAVEAVPDELVDALAVSGTPEDCRARLADYAEVLDEALITRTTAPTGHAVSTVDAYQALLDCA